MPKDVVILVHMGDVQRVRVLAICCHDVSCRSGLDHTSGMQADVRSMKQQPYSPITSRYAFRGGGRTATMRFRDREKLVEAPRL
jgi:hypothetical protein